jgi:hypothetical protein
VVERYFWKRKKYTPCNRNFFCDILEKENHSSCNRNFFCDILEKENHSSCNRNFFLENKEKENKGYFRVLLNLWECPKISENSIFTIDSSDFSDLVQKNAKFQLCRSQPRRRAVMVQGLTLPTFTSMIMGSIPGWVKDIF